MYTIDRSKVGHILSDVSAHSVVCVNSLIVIQEQKTNNMYIYNGGEMLRSFKGQGMSSVKGISAREP